MTERRNPYLILGVPYGASKSEAANAFAQATRRLRREPDGPYSLEDLNWALHQVEQVQDDPESAVAIFRVPANPEVYAVRGHGLLRPEPQPMSRQSPPADEELHESLAAAAGAELLRYLLDEHGVSVTPEAPLSIVGAGSDESKKEQ